MKKIAMNLLGLIPCCLMAQSYDIKGKVGELNDPFKVYLVYRVKGELVIDSSKLQQGMYSFKGYMDSIRPAGLVLSSAGLRSTKSELADMKTFYLGNESFTVTSNDSMRNSLVAGSHINDSAILAAINSAFQGQQVTKNWQPGDKAPEFEQPDSLGKMIKLSDYREKIVLVDFWASWCMPCRAETPNLVRAYQKFRSKGLEIISISVDDSRKAWLDAVRRDNMTWVNVSDLKTGSDNEAAKLFDIRYVPQNFLIGHDGKILGINLMGDTLNKNLEQIFSDK